MSSSFGAAAPNEGWLGVMYTNYLGVERLSGGIPTTWGCISRILPPQVARA